MAGCRCGWLLTYTAALSKDSRHHAASTSTGFASDFRRTRRHPNQPRNFTALRRYVGRIRFFIHSRSQPNNYYSSCRFRTAHRKDHYCRLTLRAAARQGVTPIGADGWARTNGLHSTWRSNRLSYVCMRGVLVFPSRQIFSVPRFCQQITDAITTSRLEGLTSGLRITHTAVPLYARHSRCPRRIGGIGGDRTHDLLITNELLCQLSYDTGSPPCLRPGGRADVRQRGLRPRDRVPARIALGTPEEWM